MLTAKKRVEKTSLIFCGFSKISALSSPFGKREWHILSGVSPMATVTTWSLVQEQSFSHSTSTFVFSVSCHCARCMWHRDSASYFNRGSFLDDAGHCHRDNRERAPTGVPSVYRYMARHWTCYPSCHIQLLESKRGKNVTSQKSSSLCIKNYVSSVV